MEYREFERRFRDSCESGTDIPQSELIKKMYSLFGTLIENEDAPIIKGFLVPTLLARTYALGYRNGYVLGGAFGESKGFENGREHQRQIDSAEASKNKK